MPPDPATETTELRELRAHIEADHQVMLRLGRANTALALIADGAIDLLALIRMDTDQDRARHAQAIAQLRESLSRVRDGVREIGGDL